MISLKAAKCPSCGADIEVNPELERGICQFCGSTILIQDAIQKIKVEHTGTIKIDGIQGESELLEIAKKHILVGETDKAYNVLEEILKENPYNLDAIQVYLELREKDLQKYLDMTDEDFSCSDMLTTPPAYYELFKTRFSNLKTLDNNGKYADVVSKYETMLNSMNEKCEKSKVIKDARDNENSRIAKISNQIVEYLNEGARKADSTANRLLKKYGFPRSQRNFNNEYITYTFVSVGEDYIRYKYRHSANNNSADTIYKLTAEKTIPLEEKLEMMKKSAEKEKVVNVVSYIVIGAISIALAMLIVSGWPIILVAGVLFFILLKVFQFIYKYIY